MDFIEPELTEDELIAAWHSEKRTLMLAFDLGVTATYLNMRWGRLRQEGKLPKERRRQRGVIEPPSPIRNNAEDTFDGRPQCVSGMVDPLLSKLYEVHKEPRPDLFATPVAKKRRR